MEHPINWGLYFDKVYCIHYLPHAKKLPRLNDELRRVGLLDNPIFQYRYTQHTRYDDEIYIHANPNKTAMNAGCINLGMETLHILNECIAFGYNRIMILEDDVAFLKDLDLIERIFKDIPEDADIIQMDNFTVPNGHDFYRSYKQGFREGPSFFNPHGCIYYSGACFALSKRGIKGMRDALEMALQPADSLFATLDRIGFKRVISDENVAIQLVYDLSMSANLWGINSHHDGYVRADVDYANYNVPEGYKYGSAIR